MLELDRVTVRYGSAVAVREVSLVAPAGEVTAIVGPNGAGKTSLAGSIYGSVPATGTIKFDGREIQNLSALDRVRSGFAYVPQGRQLFMRMSVRENLRVGADLLGLKAEAVETAFERFPILRERSESYAGVLSGGEQQMLVLGRALLETPKVLLLDEMMTGLAPKIVAELVSAGRGSGRRGCDRHRDGTGTYCTELGCRPRICHAARRTRPRMRFRSDTGQRVQTIDGRTQRRREMIDDHA